MTYTVIDGITRTIRGKPFADQATAEAYAAKVSAKSTVTYDVCHDGVAVSCAYRGVIEPLPVDKTGALP